MRYYTYSVGVELLNELEATGTVRRVLHDGSDIIHVELATGARVMAYLIERPFPAYEIKKLVAEHTAAEEYTLFMLWRELLIPEDGTEVRTEDWLDALLTLYGGRIYSYDVYMGRLFVIPIVYEQTSKPRILRVRYGDPVDVAGLRGHTVQPKMGDMAGSWRVAAFDAEVKPLDTAIHHLQGLSAQFALLQIQPSADRAAIKTAYRARARDLHPDRNRDDAATQRMQQLNVAYDAIMAALNNASRAQ